MALVDAVKVTGWIPCLQLVLGRLFWLKVNLQASAVLQAYYCSAADRVRRIEFASRDRRTLVGIRRSRRGAAGKFSQ